MYVIGTAGHVDHGKSALVEALTGTNPDRPDPRAAATMPPEAPMADTEIIFTVEEAPEGGYTASALGHPVHTEADTLDELREMVRDAVRVHFGDGDRPKLIRLHLVSDEVIAV